MCQDVCKKCCRNSNDLVRLKRNERVTALLGALHLFFLIEELKTYKLSSQLQKKCFLFNFYYNINKNISKSNTQENSIDMF